MEEEEAARDGIGGNGEWRVACILPYLLLLHLYRALADMSQLLATGVMLVGGGGEAGWGGSTFVRRAVTPHTSRRPTREVVYHRRPQ